MKMQHLEHLHISRDELDAVFSSPKFSATVFRLFDRDNSGEVWINMIIATVKESYRW